MKTRYYLVLLCESLQGYKHIDFIVGFSIENSPYEEENARYLNLIISFMKIRIKTYINTLLHGWTVEDAEKAVRDRKLWAQFLRQAAGADGQNAVW